VIFPYKYVLEPELAGLFYFSLFYLSPFLMVISIGLKILYLSLNGKYINGPNVGTPRRMHRRMCTGWLGK
jgi:hypothetical protein